MIMSIKVKTTKGFTLIEMMIAMSISLILLLGVSQIFTSNKRSQRVTEGLARVQENARFALKKISIDMRRAGYAGCAGDNILNHLDPTSPDYDESLFDPSKGTGGWEYTGGAVTSVTEPGETYNLASVTPLAAGDAGNWQSNTASAVPPPVTAISPNLPPSLVGVVVPGSDVVVMKWMDEDRGITLNGAVVPNSAQIGTKGATGIAKGTLLIISDCSGGDVFQPTSNASSSSLQRSGAQDSPGNKNPAKTPWSHAYPNGATISTFVSRAYYIGTGVSGEPSLYSITYTQGATGQVIEEVAEGIENMQVLYGIDTNDDKFAEKYVTAEQVIDHANVVNLQIGLIARSPNSAKSISVPKTLTLLGTNIVIPADNKIRFAFTTTVKLRNKGAK